MIIIIYEESYKKIGKNCCVVGRKDTEQITSFAETRIRRNNVDWRDWPKTCHLRTKEREMFPLI